MLADDELRRGDPRAALSHLQELVRRDPASTAWRVYLFQLLSVLGEWERAGTQLAVLSEMDKSAGFMAQAYAELLRCELIRGEVFAGRRAPMILGGPEPWMALMIQAALLDGQGRHSEAVPLRAQALEDAPAAPGRLDDQPFGWIADGDSRLGPLLEAVVHGTYYWVPFARIRRVAFDAPADLRDVVWMPTQFLWSNGGEAVGFVPTRYPGSESSDDGLIQLARRTEWREVASGTWFGLGQKMLATDVGESAVMDVRRIEMDVATPTGEAKAAPVSGL